MINYFQKTLIKALMYKAEGVSYDFVTINIKNIKMDVLCVTCYMQVQILHALLAMIPDIAFKSHIIVCEQA